MQAIDVGDHDVVVGAKVAAVVIGRQVGGGIGIRVNGDLDRALGEVGAAVGLLGGRRSDGHVELALVVGWRLDAQAVEVPAGDVDLATADGDSVAGAIAQYRACRNAAQLDAEGLRTIGVGEVGGDTDQLDGAVLGAFIELVALVVAFAIGTVQLADGDASIGQLVHARVHRDVGVVQVDRGTAIDRQVDVVAARAALVGVVDIQGVVAADGRLERSADRTARTPGGLGHVLAADGDQQAVIADTAEAVGLTRFEVDQAGSLRARTADDAGVGLGIGDQRAAVGLARVVEHGLQRIAGDAVAVGTQAAEAVPGFLDQADRVDVVAADVQVRFVGHRSDVDLDGAFVAQALAIGWLELDVCVVGLFVADAGATVGIDTRLVAIRHELQLAGIDVGLAEDLASIGFGQGFPDVAILVLQHAVGGQFGDGQAQVGRRGIGIGDAEVGPAQHQVGVFGTGHGAARGNRCLVADDGGGDTARAAADCQVLEVAAGGRVDLHGEVLGTLGNAITDDRHAEGAHIAARLDHHGGDAGVVRTVGGGAAVGQLDDYIGLRLVGQGQRVVGRVTFHHRGGAADADGGGVDGVGHLGDGWLLADRQVFEVATGGASDGGVDAARIDVHVIRWRRHAGRARGLAGIDGDGCTVAQGHGDRGLRLVAQGRGVGDVATFGDRWRGAQGQVGGVDGIGNAGHGGRTVDL
ncbi:hypothetical protein D3C77_235370 [compost metagenome]